MNAPIDLQDPDILRRLLRARDRMDAASHEEWPVARLAKVSHLSPAHFARQFKEAFGLPPHRYLLTRRIEKAKALLRDTQMSISEIAFHTGWSSLGTFGRTFRDVTGECPGDLRDDIKADSAALAPVPACIVAAAHRPDLDTAVSEKRRRETAAINGPQQPTRSSNESGRGSGRSVRARPGRGGDVLRKAGVSRPHGRTKR